MIFNTLLASELHTYDQRPVPTGWVITLNVNYQAMLMIVWSHIHRNALAISLNVWMFFLWFIENLRNKSATVAVQSFTVDDINNQKYFNASALCSTETA